MFFRYVVIQYERAVSLIVTNLPQYTLLPDYDTGIRFWGSKYGLLT